MLNPRGQTGLELLASSSRHSGLSLKVMASASNQHLTSCFTSLLSYLLFAIRTSIHYTLLGLFRAHSPYLFIDARVYTLSCCNHCLTGCFVIPASSALVERVFSQSGLIILFLKPLFLKCNPDI